MTGTVRWRCGAEVEYRTGLARGTVEVEYEYEVGVYDIEVEPAALHAAVEVKVGHPISHVLSWCSWPVPRR